MSACIQDNAGYTPLHEAVAANQLLIVEILLEYGANPNTVSSDGTRPIHDAAEYGNIELCRLLLQYGADATLNKFSGQSILDICPTLECRSFFDAYFKSICQKYDAEMKQFHRVNGLEFNEEQQNFITMGLLEDDCDVYDDIERLVTDVKNTRLTNDRDQAVNKKKRPIPDEMIRFETHF